MQPMASGVGTTPTTAAPPHSPITHFSHPHELHPLSLPNSRDLCSACRLQSSGVMYTCLSCTPSFALHQSCADLPRHITHPSHAGCVLSLLEKASYPGGMFSCDGCRRQGEGWAYHCARCEYDLHVTCACRPQRIRVPVHTSCDLQLVFGNPYRESNGFACDVCRKIGTKQWLYRCADCEFDVHLDCADTSQNAIMLLQTRHSSLRANSQSAHSACGGVKDIVGNPLSSPALRPALQNRHSFPQARAVRGIMQDFGANPLSWADVRRRPEVMHIGSGAYGEVHQFPGQVAGSGVGPVTINDQMHPEKSSGGTGNVESLK